MMKVAEKSTRIEDVMKSKMPYRQKFHDIMNGVRLGRCATVGVVRSQVPISASFVGFASTLHPRYISIVVGEADSIPTKVLGSQVEQNCQARVLAEDGHRSVRFQEYSGNQ